MDEIERKLDKDWYLDDIDEEQISDTEKINALYRRYTAGAGEDRGVLGHDDLMNFVDLSRRIAESVKSVRDIESAKAPEFFKRYLLRLRNLYVEGSENAADAEDAAVNHNKIIDTDTTSDTDTASDTNTEKNIVDTPVNVWIRSIMPYENELIIEGYFDIDRAGELEREYAQSAYAPHRDMGAGAEDAAEEPNLSWIDVSEHRAEKPATSKPRFLEPPLSASMIMEFGVKGFSDMESSASENVSAGNVAEQSASDPEAAKSGVAESGDIKSQNGEADLESGSDSNVSENVIRISGDTTVLDKTEPVIMIHVGNREAFLPDAGHIAERKYFGKTLVTFRTFEARIDMAALTEGTEIYFTYGAENSLLSQAACGAENDSSSGQDTTPAAADTSRSTDESLHAHEPAGKERHCRMMFSEPQSGFQPQLGILYKKYRRELALEYDAKTESFRAIKPSITRRLSAEIDALYGLRGARISGRKKLAAFGLRFMYRLTKPYYSRLKIRSYYDKLYAGGDNGQVLFEYSSEVGERKGGTKRSHRYFASPESRAYRDLRAKGLCVQSTNSVWSKLVALHAHIIFSTHVDAWGFSGLDGFERRWFSDIMDAHVVGIEHSLALRHVPEHQARYVSNTEMYCCAAYPEIDELSEPEYAYDPSMLKLTGAPKYDRLVSDAERVILLAPAWHRAENFEERPRGMAVKYDDSFAESEMFAVYRDLLTDDGLAEMLRRTGYRLRLLLHSEISAQLSDFEPFAGDGIEIAASSADGYERHLRRSALLVADYGGVQYDWAYMEKPMVYFQPDELSPPAYDTVFDYDAVGFGPVARSTDVLVAYLDGMISGGAGDPNAQHDDLVPATLYRDRMREFFAYDDRENCVRIFNEACARFK